MRSEFVTLAFYVIALILGGAAEELLPKPLGVGFPVLLALAVCTAAHHPLPVLVILSVAAGAFADALSSLPAMTSPCFFVVAALAAWRTRRPHLVMVAAYPLAQIWLTLPVPNLVGSLGGRFALAVPLALLTAAVLNFLLAWIERKGALDGAAN